MPMVTKRRRALNRRKLKLKKEKKISVTDSFYSRITVKIDVLMAYVDLFG